MVEDIGLGRPFILATTNKNYVNGLNLHQVKSETLFDYTGDFEMIGKMIVGEIEKKQKLGLKVLMTLKFILMLQIIVVTIVTMLFFRAC